MSEQLAIVLGLLAAAIAMFVINKPRMDAVALIMLAVLPFTGVLSIDEAIAGFSDSSVVLIAAMFVIGEGLVRTGVARRLGDWLTSKAGSSEVRLLVLLMLVVCGLGSVMSSTAVTAIFIPVALRCARTAGASPSRLMMPLSFAALISGMMTLVASPPNLVINSELVRHGASGFRFFTFTPFGAPILFLGILYMILARHWLSADTSSRAVAPWNQVERVQPDDVGVVVLRPPSEVDEVLPVPGKAPQAILTLGVVVAVMISGVIPNVHAALLGCLMMGALGCIDLGSAYRAIDWRIIVLIVGMLPFSIALERTGGVDLLANGMMAVIGSAGPYGILACLFAITVLLSLFMSNTATAVLMAPVAIAVAKEFHASPHPFAMTVALAASTAFITPVSSPVNTLVVTPGNYTFGDFVRVGAPFAVIVLIVTVVLVPWLLPL